MKEHEHEYFRELCALAPVGELSDEEARKLHEHLADCEECRNLSEEFERVSFGALPLRGEDEDFPDSTSSD
ncbi:MAG: zf-HC2 domain-containing protein, partial [Acidobacteriota bacterium]